MEKQGVEIEHKLTRRFLIDLSAPIEETLQIETTLTLPNQEAEKRYRNISLNIKNQWQRFSKRYDLIVEYTKLLNKFKNVQHKHSNKSLEYEYNKFRSTILQDKIPQDASFNPRDCLDNFSQSID